MRVLLVHPSALMYSGLFLRLEPLGRSFPILGRLSAG
jgi:hypothetical protein